MIRRCVRFLVSVIFLSVLFKTNAGAEIYLTWNANPESDIGGYKIHATDLGTETKSVFDVGPELEAAFEPLPGHSYVFTVTAYNLTGVESDHSDEVRYDAPLQLLTISWDRNIYSTAGQYRLSYGVLNGAAQQVNVGTNNFAQLSSLQRGAIYYFYVECFSVNGQRMDNWQQVTYSVPADGPLGVVYVPRVNFAPDVQITSPISGTTISAPATILLRASAEDFDNTIRSVDFYAGNSKLATVSAEPYQFSWTGVEAGTYQISAVATDAQGASTRSAFVTVTVTSPGPVAPMSLAASPTSDSVQLTWAHYGTDVTGFRIYRANGGTFALIATLPANTVAFTDVGLIPGTTYNYRVHAYNSSGNSPAAEISTTTRTLVPAVPADVSATPLTSAIVLSWNPSIGATDYVVERSMNPAGPFSGLGTAQITQWTDSAVIEGTTYYYRIIARGNGTSSAPSAIVSASLLTGLPATPLTFAIAAVRGEVKLSWKDDASNESSYVVERSLDGVSFSQVATLPANSSQYVDASVAPRRKYYFRVGAANAAGTSFSKVLSIRSR